MDTDNGLSEEQRLRIEENKKRALAKRQERLLSQSAKRVQHTSHSLNAISSVKRTTNSGAKKPHAEQSHQEKLGSSLSTSLTSTSTSMGTASANYNASSSGRQITSTNTRSGVPLKRGGTVQVKNSKDSWPQKTYSSNQVGGKEKIQFFGAAEKILKGQCVLVSRDRFEVNIGFNQTVIGVFKTVSSRVYDASKRKWSFGIRDHDTLLTALKDLKPAVQVEPLPRPILQVFCGKAGETTGTRFIPQADLSQVDEVLVNSLMPFQRVGVNFGVHLKGRVLIADEMGLGKTLQAICLACVYRSKWPLLIVTPSSVRFDWAQQLKRWVPSLDPERIQVVVTSRDNSAKGLVNIISYDLLSRKAKELTAAQFRVIIMDECHFLKNRKTVRTKAALPLLQSAEHVVLLSGTPALSRPSELYSQITAVCPRLFKFHDFGIRYCEGKEQPWGWDYTGSCNMEELHLLLAEKVMIRRMKKDVLSQLPAKRRQVVILDPVSVASSRSLIQASKIMEKKLSGMEKRGALLQYFHETCKVKCSAVRDYVLDMIAAEKKFIIFAHHQEMLDNIEEIVASESVQYIRIDGKTASEQRNFFCHKFQSKDDCKVAVLSITAANAGLNLSAASIVVFAELFWNPGILVQAEDRVHRLGQQDSVLVYYLVAQKTADDYVWPLVQNKLQVLGKAGLAGKDFADADTTHVRDPRQKRLLDMFEESFLEESNCQILEEGGSTTGSSSEFPPSTPKKRKATEFDSHQKSPSQRKSTGSPSKRAKLTPSKGQTGIHQFFAVDGIHIARSPQKASGTSTVKAEPVITLQDRTDSLQPHQKEAEVAVQGSAGETESSEQDRSTVGAEALADLADVDWDDDFE